jgi:hypothetical protein
MSRTIADIENDIKEIKASNPDWKTNSVVMSLLTALIQEKNTTQAIPAAGILTFRYHFILDILT